MLRKAELVPNYSKISQAQSSQSSALQQELTQLSRITQMLHVWNIDLHRRVIFGVNVGIYSIHVAYGL